MGDLVKKEHISVHVPASDWKDAIRKAGSLLVDTGDITGDYVEAMIRSVEQLGPYIVLTPGFALAHSAPSEAVKHNAVSLIQLQDPVKFGSPNDPVKVVMCLACTDKTSHIENLKKIAGKLMKPGMIDSMAEAENQEDLYQLINRD